MLKCKGIKQPIEKPVATVQFPKGLFFGIFFKNANL
jgi:hypothetical protein